MCSGLAVGYHLNSFSLCTARRYSHSICSNLDIYIFFLRFSFSDDEKGRLSTHQRSTHLLPWPLHLCSPDVFGLFMLQKLSKTLLVRVSWLFTMKITSFSIWCCNQGEMYLPMHWFNTYYVKDYVYNMSLVILKHGGISCLEDLYF